MATILRLFFTVSLDTFFSRVKHFCLGKMFCYFFLFILSNKFSWNYRSNFCTNSIAIRNFNRSETFIYWYRKATLNILTKRYSVEPLEIPLKELLVWFSLNEYHSKWFHGFSVHVWCEFEWEKNFFATHSVKVSVRRAS